MPTTKEMLVSIEENQHSQLTRCADCCKKIEKHETTLYGNGTMGLKSKVAIVFWVLGLVGSAAAIAVAGMIKAAIGI